MKQRILVTGSAGYLGRGMVPVLAASFDLRLMDVVAFDPGPHQGVVGDVADLAAVRAAVTGVDALVIAHMASRQAGAYETPVASFDANVKGTANLFFAAAGAGIARVVLVSSSGVTYGHGDRAWFAHDVPPKARDLYGLTKVCQEVIAEHYHREHGIAVAVLRIGALLSEDTMVDKYGNKEDRPGENYVDPRDVGDVARLCLGLADLTYETLFVMGVPAAAAKYDTAWTERRLGWTPKHRYGP
jgi:nucleoside-diphosphate-sugar epimerase